MSTNRFATETELIEFLQARGDRGIDVDHILHLVTFPYVTPEARALACSMITKYIAKLATTYSTFRNDYRYVSMVATFLETALYTPALYPLMRLRNRLESEMSECGPGTYGYEMVVSARNAVAALQLAGDASTAVTIPKQTNMQSAIVSLETRLPDVANHFRMAKEYVHSDPGASLVKTRQAFEKLVIAAYSRLKAPPKRSAINEILCDAQFAQGVDRRTLARMRSLQELGNVAAHGYTVLPVDANRGIEDLCEVVDWYLALDIQP